MLQVGSTRFAMAIEHFPRQRVPGLLREIRRTLEPGGVLRIITQDTQQYMKAYTRRDLGFFESQRRYWDLPRELGPLLHHVLVWAGTSRRPDDFFDHKYGYDFESLSRLLRDAGFVDVERSAYMVSRHPDLRIDVNSLDADARHGDVPYALFVEATRPADDP